ncbi:hypothetical protein IPC1067_05940 [Pseudomonas aeruginosa]|nr:hypothetical protein IPC1067_05940 [Pseudomonas aeruginosa]
MQPALNAFPEQPADTAEATSRAGLEQAFALFNQMSSQLSESYSLLEERVTELKGQLALVSAQRMEELAEKERLANRLQSLLDLLPGGVIVIDAHGVVREANPAALGLLGEPLVGMLWREVIARCFAPREDDGHEISLRDGRRLSIATRSLNGEPGQLILLNDLTDTRRLQEQLARHERLSALGRMVASLAHQIRTPLSAALLYAGHLSEQALPTDQQQRFAGRLKERLHELEHQVRDMLVFARGELPLTDRVARHALGQLPGSEEDGPVALEPASRQLLELAARVARSDSTVLISGESGTGKEVLANYIHQQSPRAGKPFIAINCAAIPDNMLEATLFGHEKGSFTGAIAAQPGKFELADGGTILLDEISEMPLGLQAKLLRVLQEREVERVGARKPINLDIRVLATTNRDLAAEVAAGRFREDLYYRLSVFPLAWRPLRERPADILPLAERLLRKHSRKMNLGAVALGPEAAQCLVRHAWPGNVRELDNAIQRALILQQGGLIQPADLCLTAPIGMPLAAPVPVPMPAMPPATPPSVEIPSPAAGQDASGALGDDLRRREFQVIIDTLRTERGRRKEAAERLGISPRTLRYKLAQMRDAGMDVEAYLYAI